MKGLLCVILGVILLFILVWSLYRDENFTVNTVKTDTETKYYAFATKMYNPFMVNWEKAIISSIGLDAPAPNVSSAAPTKSPSKAEMNQYIEKLSAKIGKPLPPLTDLLPEIMDMQIPIPSDPVPFTNALQWMNTQLEKSHEHLGTALEGGNPLKEGFITGSSFMEAFDSPSICQQVVQCQQQQQDPATIAAKQKEADASMNAFVANGDFQRTLMQNLELMEKSKKIQDAAQSGELLGQMKLPKENKISYSLPKGSNALSKMKSENPGQYAEYQKNYGQLFSLKGLMDQINSNLH